MVAADLARRAAVSPAAVSRLLAALEQDGLIASARFDDDRRRQPLALTGQGQVALRSAQAALLADVPPAEADALARLLERLQASLSGTPPPPRPRRGPPAARP